MPRKKRGPDEYRAVDLVAQVEAEPLPAPGRRHQKRHGRRLEDSSSSDEHSAGETDHDFHNICPCSDCANLPRPTVRFMSVIERHLAVKPIAPRYEAFYLAGLGQGPSIVDLGDSPQANLTQPSFGVHDPLEVDEEVEHPDVVMADFILTHLGVEPCPLHLDAATVECEGLTTLEREAATPIYSGARTNRLAIIMLLLKLQAKHPKMTNVCFNDVLNLINDHVVDPKLISKMPRTREEARKVVSEIGLDYETIDACPCDGMLYFGEKYKDLKRCPLPGCGKSRYCEGLKSKEVPRKRMHYFPITPRIQAIFRCPALAKLMAHHFDALSQDGFMRIPSDSKAWKHILAKYPFLATRLGNIFLGFATDGVNPYGHNATSHSIWPILLVNLNLPPWLAIKPTHIILSAIIPGKRKVKDMNVYLRPLVEELKTLWKVGAKVRDMSLEDEASRLYTVRACVMWTMHDYPGYGIASSLQTQGYFACPPCGPEEVPSHSALHLGKIIFHGHRKYLRSGHLWRTAKYNDKFNKNDELSTEPPKRWEGWDWLCQWGKVDENKIALDESGMTGSSIFFELEYWADHLIPHLLDVMHIEKNVCSSLFKTITNAKGTKSNSVEQRLEMKAMGIMESMWATDSGTVDGKGNTIFTSARAPWVLSRAQFQTLIDVIRSIKTPRGYGSSFQYKFPDYKISGMKTHDYHNLLHHILPIAIRGLLTKDIRDIIYKLGALFRWLCSKEIKECEIKGKVDEAAELMCLMGQHLPPSFFDIQPHSIVHLPGEVELAGPVHYRWMYYLERYMKVMKDWVRQMARLEGSMAEGYVLHEGMHYLTEHTTRLSPQSPQLWQLHDDPTLTGLRLPKVHKVRRLGVGKDLQGLVFLQQVHAFVLRNDPALAKWRSSYDGQGTSDLPEFGEWVLSQMRGLISLKINVPDREYHLALGPHSKVKFFSHMWVEGKFFRIEGREGVSKATADSGISADFRAGEEASNLTYYGRIQSIVQVKFTSFELILLKGKWFNSESTSKTRPNLVRDECGFMRVKTTNPLPSHLVTHEPFVYPETCDQIFFANDRLHKGWNLVVPMEVRAKRFFYKGTPAQPETVHCDGDDSSSPSDTDSNDSKSPSPENVASSSHSHCDLDDEPVSAEFENEELDSGDEQDDGQAELEVEYDYEVDLDVNLKGVQVPMEVTLRPRTTARRYVGEQLIAEDSTSEAESEGPHDNDARIGHSENEGN